MNIEQKLLAYSRTKDYEDIVMHFVKIHRAENSCSCEYSMSGYDSEEQALLLGCLDCKKLLAVFKNGKWLKVK